MDFSLTEDQLTLKKSAREFLAAEAPISLARRMLDDPTGFDAGLWSHMAELGWMGITVPESDGGLGLGLVELALVLEEMGRVVAPSPFFSTVALALPILQACGGAPDGLVASIAAGERKLTAALDGEAVVGRDGTLSGTLMFVPDAHLADDIVVAAGDSVFLVRAADATIAQLDSLDKTRRFCSVTLDAAPGVLLGEAASAIDHARDRAAVALAAEATGVADAVLERSAAYVRERQQFGRAIGSFQAVSHKVADMLIAVESGRSTTYHAAWSLDEGDPGAPLAAATAKSCASTGAVKACEDGIQVHGGIGFTWEHDLHLYLRRAKLTELYLGSAQVWRDRIVTLLD